MKLSAIAAASFFFLTASASTDSLFSQVTFGRAPSTAQGSKVPGENPLYYCGSTKDDVLKIETVDLVPNPPTA